MLFGSRVIVASFVLFGLLPTLVHAQQLSPGEALLIGSGQSDDGEQGFWGELGIVPEVTATSDSFPTSSIRGETDRPTGAIIGLGGPFGVIVDYSTDTPRVRGLAFEANNALRLEARGELDTESDDIGGKVSVHFNF